MRKIFISFLTVIFLLTFSIPTLADGDWHVVKQVIDNDHRVGITVGTENATPNTMFAISDTLINHDDLGSWSEPRLLVSNDRGETWRQIKWPQAQISTIDYKLIPYFYKGKLRVDVEEYEVYHIDLIRSTFRFIRAHTYETTDGSSWSIINDPKKHDRYYFILNQGELMAIPEQGWGIRISTNVQTFYRINDQTVLFVKDDGTLYRAVINGSKALINGVKASAIVTSELSNSDTRVIAAVKYQPVAISISIDNGFTWTGINCEIPGKVFGSNKNLKIYLTNNGLICITDLSKNALVSNNNGMSWKTIDLPILTGRNIGESMQFINDNGKIIVFYVTSFDTYRYEYTMQPKADVKPIK